MYGLNKEKIECALGNREIWFLGQGQECCVSFLTWGFATHICI